jgi:hypothetical protein
MYGAIVRRNQDRVQKFGEVRATTQAAHQGACCVGVQEKSSAFPYFADAD